MNELFKQRQKETKNDLINLINSIPEDKELCVVVTYRDTSDKDTEEVRRGIVNYLRKIKRIAKDKGWTDMKYAYFTKSITGRSVELNGNDGK